MNASALICNIFDLIHPPAFGKAYFIHGFFRYCVRRSPEALYVREKFQREIHSSAKNCLMWVVIALVLSSFEH